MEVHRNLTSLPSFKNAVLTIGSFDGVHNGHRAIFSRIKQIAREHHGETVVLTFHPHPRQVIYPKDSSLKLLTTIEEKITHFTALGLDHLVIVPFSVEFSQLHPADYAENFLLKKFKPKFIVIGYDHRFGLNRSGDIRLLRQYEQSHQFQVVEIEKQAVDDMTVSSTQIRNALLAGEVERANQLLGYPYSVQGTVVPGERVGRGIGFPTANIVPNHKNKLIPVEGIYAVHIHVLATLYQGMLYIGTRPTIGTQRDMRLEVNIFNFNREIYGEDIEVIFLKYLRKDLHLDGLKQLRKQLTRDKKTTLSFFAEYEGVPGN